MAVKSRKSMLGDLRKMFRNEREPDVPAVPAMPRKVPVGVAAMPRKEQIDIPVKALRISRHGLVQNLELTFYRKSDKRFLIDNNHYYVPRCMQAPGTTNLDPVIRRFTWVFKKAFASESTAAKQESFIGAYSVWYKDTGTPANPKTLSQIEGEFWMMKQVQNEPEPGDTIEWEHLPKDMARELNNDWWFMGVQLPDIDAVCIKVAANSRGRPF